MGLLEAIEGRDPAPGLPPVLLVHGFASSFEHNWRRPGWVDLLTEDGREVIGVDLLGHGNSPRSTDPEDYDGVEDAVLAAVADHPRVDAVGFSMGARVVLTLAARDPARFRRIVVIGVGANLVGSASGPFGDDPDALARVLEGGSDPANVTARVFTGMAASAGNDLAALAAFARRRHPGLTREDLARIRCPVRIVIGDEDFAGPGEPLAGALPDADLVTLRGVDHFRATEDFLGMKASMDWVNAAP